jgi:aspartyl-tRNA synthetase
MYRTHTCGELKINDAGKNVTLCGWVQRSRDLGGMTFIDLRDRYGLTQLVFNMESDEDLCKQARKLGREFVIRATGEVSERSNKNRNIPTGEIEIKVTTVHVLNAAETPPFTIEDETDGGEELRMKYRYLDLRRTVMKNNLVLRHKMAQEARAYLSSQNFIEVETPVLIKSTPEGARDFIVPSRMNAGYFYALPQSPQTFKQLLMVAGYDRYFQLVKCFRDEDFRSDRQPEFTQIDCEMAFVEQEDILNTFEGLIKSMFQKIKGINFKGDFPRLTYTEAMEKYGSDKPDIRFQLLIHDLTDQVKGKGFKVFDSAEYIGGICAPGLAGYSRKQLDELTEFVTKPQIGAKGLIYVKSDADGSIKSSVDKFYDETELRKWATYLDGKPGDLILVMAGEKNSTLNALGELRLEMAKRLGLMKKDEFAPLWVLDFPLFEWDENTKRFYAKHHPFTSPRLEDLELLETDPASVRANAYDMVLNGVEIGGGSIRIHDKKVQETMFRKLGFTEEDANAQFGFLMNAFRFGAPPHGGIAFGFDRLVALFAGLDSIRDVIAFPKNNSGKDIMIDSPAPIARELLDELSLSIKKDLK